MPISNNDPMYPELTPDQIARMQAQQEAASNRVAAQQAQFQDLNRDWIGQSSELRNAPGANERAGNAKGYMGQQRSRAEQNYGRQRQVPFGDDGNFVSYGQHADQMNKQRAYLQSLAGDTNYMDPSRGGFVEPMQPRLEGPDSQWNKYWESQPDGKVGKNFASRYVSSPKHGVPLPSNPPGPYEQAQMAQLAHWAGMPDEAVTPAWSARGVAPDHMAAMKTDPRAPWSAPSARGVYGGTGGGEIATRAPLMGEEAGFGPKVGTAVRSMEEGVFGPRITGGAAAAAGGRAAGAARGAMGMFGGPMALGALGVLNNAVDLSNPNSVMRKAIHEGNYGTALARGAANFVPFAGTIWDNLVSNNHPEQPTVNKPQATDPETPLDLTDAFPGDPLKHGNYTSRQEMQENYKLQKTFEPKPQVEAAQNQMRALSRDVALAKASNDEKRYRLAMDNYMKFERLLALGQNSYPYMTSAMTPVEYDWLGGQ